MKLDITTKLDRVRPVDNRPFTDKINQYKKLKIKYNRAPDT